MILTLGPSLWHLLQLIPPADQDALAERLGVASDRSTIYQALVDAKRYHPLIDGLSTQAKTFLAEVLLSGGRISFERAFETEAFSQILDELVEGGLIYAMEDRSFKRYFTFPHEYDNYAWSKTVIATLEHRLEAKEVSPRREHQASDWFPFMQDVYQVLSFARTEPLQRTQQGFLYKRVETKLGQRLWPKAPADQIALRLNLILHFALDNHLMGYDDAGRSMQVDEEVAAEFFAMDIDRRYHCWFAFASAHSQDASLRQIIMATAAFLQPEQWIDIEALRDWLSAHHVLARAQGSHVLSAHIEHLTDLDLWEGDDHRGRLSDFAYFGIAARFAPTAPGQAVVQPTGEVLVPPESPFMERWRWDQITTLIRADRMSVYQIDSQGMERALDLEVDMDTLLSDMEDMSKSGMPSNVRANVEDWRRALTRHRVLQATIVHSSTPQDSLEAAHRLGHRVISRLSDTDIIIQPSSALEAISTLKKAGIMMRRRVERPGVEPPSALDREEPPWESWHGDEFNDPLYAVRAQVPPLHMEIPDYPNMRAFIQSAIDDRALIRVTYLPPGHARVITHKIVPYQLQNDWMYGTVLGSPQVATVQLQRIQSMAREASS